MWLDCLVKVEFIAGRIGTQTCGSIASPHAASGCCYSKHGKADHETLHITLQVIQGRV